MADVSNSGFLRNLLNFQQRSIVDDGFGNTTASGPFETVFQAYGQLKPLHGRESVMAQRLQGVQPYQLTIRWHADAAAVTPAWQVVDERSGTIYQIKSPPSDPDNKRAWLDMIVQVGTPS